MKVTTKVCVPLLAVSTAIPAGWPPAHNETGAPSGHKPLEPRFHRTLRSARNLRSGLQPLQQVGALRAAQARAGVPARPGRVGAVVPAGDVVEAGHVGAGCD